MVSDPLRPYWRRQAVLVGLAAVGFVVVAALVQLAVIWARGPSALQVALGEKTDSTAMVIVLVVAALVLTALLGAAIVHTVRIATYTFRREEQ